MIHHFQLKQKNEEDLAIWKNLVGVVVTDTSIEKTAPVDWGNGGAFSVSSLILANDGYVEFKFAQTDASAGMGLSIVDDSAHYDTIDYCLLCTSIGDYRVYENGSLKFTGGAYSTADVFRVEKVGNTVYYKKNGTTFYTSGATVTTSLSVDCAIRQNGGTINNIDFNF